MVRLSFVTWRSRKSTERSDMVEVNRMFQLLIFNSEMNCSQSFLFPVEAAVKRKIIVAQNVLEKVNQEGVMHAVSVCQSVFLGWCYGVQLLQ